MSASWAMQFLENDPSGLERLRPFEGIKLLHEEELLWVKGQSLNENLQQSLCTLPGIRFEVWEDQQLVEAGRKVPWGYLPDGNWVPLKDWLDIQLPVLGFPAQVSPTVELQLIRSSVPQTSNVLLTEFNMWEAFAATAPKLRLDQLTFAVTTDAPENSPNCIVRGEPLPPISGKQFVEVQGIAVPAGYRWSPMIDAAVLSASLNLREQDLAILHLNQTWELILREQFVAATRMSVRTTGQAISS